MKKCLLCLVFCALLLLWSYLSFHAGVLHAIEDSVIWTVDCYNPENPMDSAWNEFDQKIFIELDGNLYEHGMYQM